MFWLMIYRFLVQESALSKNRAFTTLQNIRFMHSNILFWHNLNWRQARDLAKACIK
jgi:hypothetical protein